MYAQDIDDKCGIEIKEAMSQTIDFLFNNELLQDVCNPKLDSASNVLGRLNQAASSLIARNQNLSYAVPLSPFDCILLNKKCKELKK